ncbi:CIR protein [Plasmodium chabaudi chabaudi]|uniref:CIR protein n=1 Tax=Plasmodium chabaudi chabaudi TaxID=31271 RepID=A0A1D3L8S6_PLACU|nr:CIR protein [Plasmodium chabaudi chabaudi]
MDKHKNINNGLKDANLRNMCEFYALFNHICNTIADYKTNGAKSNSLFQKSVNCLNKHRPLYENIYKCNPYLDLLGKLKNIYTDCRDSVIKKETGNNLYPQFQKRTTTNKNDSYFAKSFEAFKLNNLRCKPKNKLLCTRQIKENYEVYYF